MTIKDALGLGALLLGTVGSSLPLVPDPPHHHLAEPAYLGVVGLWLTTLLVVALRLRAGRGSRAERRALAACLAGMPLVYLGELLRGPWTGGGLLVELGGLLLFAGLAWLGLVRSAWWLAGGVLAHGLLWDASHRGGLVVPGWYSVGCLVADVGLALYVASQVEAFAARSGRAAQEPSR